MATQPSSSLSSTHSADDASISSLERMAREMEGELCTDHLHRMLYAQDASVYQEEPVGVAFPRSVRDVQALARTANALGIPLIPRAGGTSLAGQCVGPGLVVDTGRHMRHILEINTEQRWVRVQPGVILDDLNRALKPYGLFFGPDTSTSNRCMIGGMVGNNSCGTHSILYGTTRDHVIEAEVVFSDGTLSTIGPWSEAEHATQMRRDDALGHGLTALDAIVREHADLIRERYPRPEVKRRNTGYAFDEILAMRPYTPDGREFNLNRLLCGSEGTLGLVTEIKLNLVDAPARRAMICAHFNSLEDALRATLVAVRHTPAAVELIDRRILDLAMQNIEQSRNSQFVQGEPEALLAIEFYRGSVAELDQVCEALVAELTEQGLGYCFPRIDPPHDKAVWDLRKAGLGILMGAPGDVKPVTVVEDTAVAVEVLPEYIHDFAQIMAHYGTRCVYYAHASVGELHLRPELNIKEREDADKFVKIARDVTDLVKKYGGSMSGEHGDGRLRSPMIAQFYGAQLTDCHTALKRAFDPDSILNPHKIVDPLPISEGWRFVPGEATPQVPTYFDWEADEGLVRAVEKCNGAGACRKLAESGGTMCPSYMATLDEKDTTRGRANVFRQLFRENADPREAMASPELYEALDLCLACKGCKSECPASVDMGRMKTEFLQHYHDAHGTPLSARLFANYGRLSKLAAAMPGLANLSFRLRPSRWVMGKLMNLAPARSLPAYAPRTFSQLFDTWRRRAQRGWEGRPTVGLYVDPFTEYTEPEIAMAAARVLDHAGWRVEVVPIEDDGRTYLSKGLVRDARAIMEESIRRATTWMERHPDALVVGMEPSSLLTFRDEAPDLVHPSLRGDALRFGERCRLIDEFVVEMHHQGLFEVAWPEDAGEAILHGHCHQKAIVGIKPTVDALELAGYRVRALNSGCCGMAGSFGYEAKHYEVSMKIGELVLFPAVRSAPDEALIAAPGTSCRHQIMDGTGRRASHPAVLMARALGLDQIEHVPRAARS